MTLRPILARHAVQLAGVRDLVLPGEQDAVLAQTVGPSSAFYSCISAGMCGPTRIAWAGLTPNTSLAPVGLLGDVLDDRLRRGRRADRLHALHGRHGPGGRRLPPCRSTAAGCSYRTYRTKFSVEESVLRSPQHPGTMQRSFGSGARRARPHRWS